jgi:hypothetical protein
MHLLVQGGGFYPRYAARDLLFGTNSVIVWSRLGEDGTHIWSYDWPRLHRDKMYSPSASGWASQSKVPLDQDTRFPIFLFPMPRVKPIHDPPCSLLKLADLLWRPAVDKTHVSTASCACSSPNFGYIILKKLRRCLTT